MAIFSNEETLLIIDIGNGTVGGALLALSKNTKPNIAYTVRLPLSILETPDPGRLVEDLPLLVGEVLTDVLREGIKKAGEKKISGVLVSFSSPWFVLKTKHLQLTQDRPFLISQEFLDDIVGKEERVFTDDLKKGSTSGGEFKVIEKSIVHTKINGYIIENNIGQKTKSFDAFLCLSAIEKNVADSVLDSILKHVNVSRHDILLHTFPLISFSILRDMYPGNSSFILMDISADVTDLTLVNNNVIEKSVSFPSGKNFIIRQLAKSTGATYDIALSMLHQFNNKDMDDVSNDATLKVLSNVEKEWSIYFESALGELSPAMTLPGLIYITSDSDVSDIYSDFIKLSKTDSTGAFRKQVNVTKIGHEELQGLCDVSAFVEEDEFLEIESIFYKKIFNE